MILFRHTDARFPFLWESADQPPARWHGEGEGPVNYFADTPDGAWAEFLRHEEIGDTAELDNVTRALWAVEVSDDLKPARPDLPQHIFTGGRNTWPACRREAGRLKAAGAAAIRVPSAALLPGGAHGYVVEHGIQPGKRRDGVVYGLFGAWPALVGWPATIGGRPHPDLFGRVRKFPVAKRSLA